MTIIAGLVHAGGVTIAADSYGVVGQSELDKTAMPKIWRMDRAVVGSSGTYLLNQLLRYVVPLDLPADPDAVFSYLVVTYSPAIHAALKERDGLAEGNQRPGNVLLGCDGRLYRIDGNGSVVLLKGPFAAIGCGCDYATGAYWALNAAAAEPEPLDRLHMVVQLAIDLDTHCNGPVLMESTP